MAPPTRPGRVLVVDDDAMGRELLGVLLEAEGYTVQSADCGAAALALLKTQPAAPHIVLTDLQMPGIRGVQLADALRAACGPGTRLLAMSGSPPPADVASRFDSFLMKPFTMAQFKRAASASANPEPVANQAPTALSEPSYDALDETIFSKLAASMPSEQLHTLYQLCLKDARQRIAHMRQLAQAGDAPFFVREAHAIKGACGMLGASELYAIAASMEKSGPEVTNPVNQLDKFLLACERLERILRARAVPSS